MHIIVSIDWAIKQFSHYYTDSRFQWPRSTCRIRITRIVVLINSSSSVFPRLVHIIADRNHGFMRARIYTRQRASSGAINYRMRFAKLSRAFTRRIVRVNGSAPTRHHRATRVAYSRAIVVNNVIHVGQVRSLSPCTTMHLSGAGCPVLEGHFSLSAIYQIGPGQIREIRGTGRVP